MMQSHKTPKEKSYVFLKQFCNLVEKQFSSHDNPDFKIKSLQNWILTSKITFYLIIFNVIPINYSSVKQNKTDRLLLSVSKELFNF